MSWYRFTNPMHTIALAGGRTFVASSKYMCLTGDEESAVRSKRSVLAVAESEVPAEKGWCKADIIRATGDVATYMRTQNVHRPLPDWKSAPAVVIVGRAPSAAGFRTRFPRPVLALAINPGHTSAAGVNFAARPDDVDCVAAIDAEYYEHRHGSWLNSFAGPVLGPDASVDYYTGAGTLHGWDRDIAALRPIAETMNVAMCYVASKGVKQIIISGCDLTPESTSMWVERRARLGRAIDYVQTAFGAAVWRDPAATAWDFAPVWKG